jgi:predicted metal-dependent HD superfamily phosphohydrolase
MAAPAQTGEDEQVVLRAWDDLGGDRATIVDVLDRHCEPHRRYHTVAHVASVLRTIDELLADFHPSTGESLTHGTVLPRIIRMAAVFHDAVYDPRSADNERRSADLACAACVRMGWAPAEVAEVRRLILATAGHACAPDDTAAAVLLDSDLAVLGAQPGAYAAYVAGVRSEYAHVDESAWRLGRSVVLRGFLERDHIYTTALMRTSAEPRARMNLSTELAELQPSG